MKNIGNCLGDSKRLTGLKITQRHGGTCLCAQHLGGWRRIMSSMPIWVTRNQDPVSENKNTDSECINNLNRIPVILNYPSPHTKWTVERL